MDPCGTDLALGKGVEKDDSTEGGWMIPEDTRKATERTRAAQNRSQAEQFIVLLAGAGALLVIWMA